MSIALMTLAWKANLPSGPKMVLLALCDHANDQGECFPSVSMMAEKCSMGERTVQEHIASLSKSGYVVREMRKGQSTIYRVNPAATPAESAPREIRTPQISHPTPADFAPPPPQISHPTPAKSAPITINEPSIEPSGNRQKKPRVPRATDDGLDLTVLPPELSLSLWKDFMKHRKGKRAPVNTQAVVDSVAEELRQAMADGWTADAAIREAIAAGWTGIKAEWLRNRKGGAAPRAGPQRPQNKQQQLEDANQAAVDEWLRGGGRVFEGETTDA